MISCPCIQNSMLMAKKAIKTSINISATPEMVWGVLTDFESYGEWNPFLKSISGEIREGNKIQVNAGGMKFSPEVLVFKENTEFRWIGKLLFKGIFDGEHSFEIIDNKDGTVTFKHEEEFNGILVGMFSKKLDTETRSGFEQMNLKLKERAESKNQA